MGEEMTTSAISAARRRLSKSLTDFRDDERGAMAVFILLMFVVMFMFGGIAIDVMRYETRRVALQQTMDRAALAAASLTQTRTGQEIAEDWFEKAQLNRDIPMVTFSDPTVRAINDAGLRRVTIDASVRSNNFFMGKFYREGGIFDNMTYLAGPARSEAAQGVSEIEVMLVLDITGSMGDPLGDGRSKIQAMRTAAQEFVNIVKANDTRNGVSIGVVPYAAQVNIPAELRAQFNALNISTWDGVANAGVPNINCFEFPTSSFTSTAFPLSEPIRMAAVADGNSGTTTDGRRVSPQSPSAGSRACTTNAETGGTPWVDGTVNHVLLPTKDPVPVNTKIARLTAAGNTSIAVGMRWGTALIDEAARPIYTALGDASVQGRPANNDSIQTRKIIILMTDGEHVTNTHIRDDFKTGLSPIWRGADGNFAIRFVNPASPAEPIRPGSNAGSNSCSGWRLSNYNSREYFVPHLKRNWVDQNDGNDPEGDGDGESLQYVCDPQAWRSSPTWDGSGATRQLDWSEVWRHVRVSWVAQQLYVRSGVTGTGDFNAMMNQFRTTYLSSVSNMNTLLQRNCTAARNAGIEVYGIAFAAPTNGQTQIRNCSSSPRENYYFNATDGARLQSAFQAIATDISELRLTQ